MTLIADAPDAVTGAPRLTSFSRLVLLLLAVGLFGPYLFGGVRTEQVVGYGLFVLLVVRLITREGRIGLARVPIIWLTYVSVGVVALLVGPVHHLYSPGSILAGLDNVLLPIALIVAVWAVVPSSAAAEALIFFLRALSVGMALNALIAALSSVVDITEFLRPFWAMEENSITVASNASALGRFSGIFNQPAEAGLLYGVAGLAAIYAWRNRPLLLATLVVAIVFGGVFSVSKVFVLGGLPLMAVYLVISLTGAARARFVVALAASLAGVALVAQSSFFNTWQGFTYFQRLFDWEGADLLTLFSAGRIGDNATTSQVVQEALATSPVVGIGVGGWATAYDSAFVEALVTAGLVGVLLYGIVLIIVLSIAVRLRGDIRPFAILFSILVISGCLGFSPLTANRVSTAVWVIIALMALALVEQRSQRDPAHPSHPNDTR